MIVMIMKTIVIIIQKKKKLWKNKTNKIRFIHFPLGRGQRANWANGQTEKMLRNQSNQCESVPASTSSSPDRQTKRYTDTSEVLQQRCCVASTPQLKQDEQMSQFGPLFPTSLPPPPPGLPPLPPQGHSSYCRGNVFEKVVHVGECLWEIMSC